MTELTNNVTVTLGDSIDTDAIIAFANGSRGRDNAWITLHLGDGRPSFSLNVVKTDEGIVLDLYPLDKEDEGVIATTFAFDNEVEGFDDKSSLLVHFQPEAWINNTAVPVDDEGEDMWLVAESTARLIGDELPDLDFVRDDAFAPKWIKEWSGPFTITVVE